MKIEDIPTPEAGAGQVLVRIEAAGVNPVDTYILTGTHSQKPRLPYTPGKDGAGTVEKIGEGVVGFNVGERVYTAGSLSGTYAEFALCDESEVHPLPGNVSFEQGAGVFVPYATAYRALFQKAGGKAGETVLVHGASGGVGIASIQWAKNAGLTVFGTASSEEGKQLVLDQGADHVFDHSKENYLADILDVTEGRGVDIILEMLANHNLQKDFDVIAKYGRISVIGNRGSIEFNPRAAMSKDATIYGLTLFSTPEAQMKEIHEAIYKGLAEGYLNPVIGTTFPLEDAAAAHHAVIENKAAGKIVLNIGDRHTGGKL